MADLIVLNNGQVEAAIHPKGAELQSLVNLHNGEQYMWSGDPAWWGKFSPVLFPIVGSLKNNIYRYNGNEYTLPRHGFARDRTFLAEQISNIAALFTLRDDADTREQFPFPFKLELYYALIDDQLSCRYTVTNTGESDLYFSLGAHPAFATGEGSNFLVFEKSKELERWRLEDGLISDCSERVPISDGRLKLETALFAADALVLKGLPDEKIILEKENSSLEFSWEGFPFFGIWAAAGGAPFVCLEPWCGIADSVDHNQELTQKEGIQSLPPGEEFSREWKVRPK